MKKILSFCAAILFAAGMMADPVVLPATLDVSNVSFRSEGMPDFTLAEGDYAGTYFDMGAHDSANDTLLYAEWDVTIQPIKYNVAVVVYNTNSWRVQLDLLNQSDEVVKAIRYKGSSGQCGQYAIGALDLSDLAAGNYKVRVHAATAWSAMKLKDVIFEADYQGVSVALPGTLTPAYALLSSGASVANNAIAFAPSTAPSEYATWNVSFAAAGNFNVSIDMTATNGHTYGVALLSADGQTEIGAVAEAQAWDTGAKELGAIEVPAAGNYVVKLTNATQWSEAVLNSITFAASAAPEVGDPKAIYLKPEIWNTANAKFGVYAFQDGLPEYFSDIMTLAENETDIYVTTIPENYTHVVFMRLNDGATTVAWNQIWNQSEDLTIPENMNMFTISSWDGGADGKSAGTWSVYIYVEPVPTTTFRVGGEGADYATLSAAAAALRENPLTSDVTLLICADIAETGNVGIVNNTDYTLTIRPDAAVKRTISFGTVPDNIGPSGHIIIGYDLTGWASTDTRNVVIDGSFEGEGQYLEIQGGTIGGVEVVYYGHVTNSVVKNCRLISPRTSSTTYVVHFRSEMGSDKAPEGVGFENCYMQVTGVSNAQAVYFNGSQSATDAGKPKDCYLRDCEIVSNLRGVFFNGAINAVFEGNTFRFPAASAGFLAHAIMGNAQKGTIVVRGNNFIENKSTNVSAGAYGMQVITASGGSDVWVIENNVFAGMDVTAAGAAGKNLQHVYVRCGDSCVVRNNTFYMPVLTNKPATELVAAQGIACVWLAGAKAYPVENNLFVSMETEAHNSLIRGALNANVKNNAFYHAGGNAAILAGAVVAADYKAFLPIADEGSVWTQPAFSNAPELDFTVALNQALLMPRNEEVLKDINGNDRRENTYAGAIEGPEATAARYLAGNGKDEWCEGKNWSANGTALVNGRIRYNSLPAGKYEFKITDGTWGYTMDYSKVVDESKANHVFTEGDGGNIMFMLAEPSWVAIQVEGEAVRVMGNFVAKPAHFLSGNGHEDVNGVWCNGANWSLSATPLFGDSIVYENLQSGMVFQFKVTNGTWSNALNINNVLAECRANYVYGTDNITFQMAQDGPVVIKMVGDSVGVYGNFADPDAVAITSYTIVGDAALVGSSWDVSDTSNDMTDVNGVWSLAKENVMLDAGTYWYKVVGNHSYAVFEYPGAQQSQSYDISESGVYTLTFTFIPGETPELTLSALKTGTALEENTLSDKPVKFIYNGQVCIRRNGVIYSVTGARIQ